MDWKTVILVLFGLLIGMVAIDVDHLIIHMPKDGNLANNITGITNLSCMWEGFKSMVSPATVLCKENQDYGQRFLHNWNVGLFLIGFVASFYIVARAGED